SAFECGDAPFEHVAGRVADSAVAVALNLKIEEGRTVLGAVEGVSHRLINRHGDRPGSRIDFVATVNGNGFVPQIPVRNSNMLIECAARLFTEGSSEVR